MLLSLLSLVLLLALIAAGVTMIVRALLEPQPGGDASCTSWFRGGRRLRLGPEVPRMAWPTSLQVALKEWDTVCRALGSGRQMLLLRKGGISESGGGEFQVEHREFLLFPTFLHQNLNMLKPTDRGDYAPLNEEPGEVALAAAGVVADVIQLKSRDQMNRIDDEHVWTAPLLDMRFNYRPENPLYLLIIRAYRLHAPVTIVNTPAYAGCKSWVPLESSIETGDALPVLDDVKFEVRRRSIVERIGA